MLNSYVFFRADDTALQGGQKIAGKWAHLKAAEEEGREDTARLRVSGERGDDEEAERKSGRQATFFSLCESKRPFFCREKLERGEEVCLSRASEKMCRVRKDIM